MLQYFLASLKDIATVNSYKIANQKQGQYL